MGIDICRNGLGLNKELRTKIHCFGSKSCPYGLIFHPHIEENACYTLDFLSEVNWIIKIKRKFIQKGFSFPWSSSQWQQSKNTFTLYYIYQKSRIGETPTLSTDADSSTDAVNFWEAWNWSCDLRANERPWALIFF